VSRDKCVGLHGNCGQRELLQSPPRTRGTEIGGFGLIALVFTYDVADPAGFERVYGPEGEWAKFFRTGRGYVGTELLQDVEIPDRYLVVDRWESRDAYNEFVAANREEYMRRVDETAFHYASELRLGTFETIW
jgi:heme-degrading monooxygenase HmoA